MKILVESENVFYKKGLETLILALAVKQGTGAVIIADCVRTREGDVINVIFRDSAISINMFKKDNPSYKSALKESKETIQVPFSCRNRKLTEIGWMIEKILFIASMSLDDFVNDDFYQVTGLRKHEQLSLTEANIVLLIGKGNNVRVISKELRRSEKTINVHCRNASRKMGMINKVDFYNYAKFIATCRKNERKTLCL
ncbi:helix-turn-helix domain-containing protein [Erwinia sorbitola]|uniref:LuxR family transcriptional regulator n=1 Tax=Erwinia sorbitola TaxID=2681984 RepID=A0ABW9RDL2_9GAMM|nr:helix-turn-helix transcriptional regulator [Erwinia sorbitola]MTD28134.1 LuxR family transcriptional regulator [Erwinia sorbitola]